MLSIKKQEILTYERKIDFPMIVASEEPSVMALKKDYDSLFNFVVMCCGNYLEMCFPLQVGIAPVIANDLIDRNPTWKAMDFVNLFKFFRQRQDLEGLRIFGNTITPIKVMEMATVYESERSAALEQYHASKKSQTHQQREYHNTDIKSLMGKELDRVSSKREQFPLVQNNPIPDEKYFKQ